MYADEIENELSYLLLDKKEKSVALHVHPYLEGYFKKGFNSKRFKWFMKYKKWVPIIADSNMHVMAHKFFDSKVEQIEV